ncbi:hypothetical protein SAMN06297387_13115 [Streptomyces zhaozhouensis]|uniref:Uncharacterized protein n=1 Tax=Streptomyces zhaozhouensis TaxID=1300267 RepID=A0A286E961_9ACTN|nr:hypothetical protein [Streptomyces zhaozhouensis]SOD67431.1 hypothetical protein SAMN06297387_13115 [Streptomyces zhaozhouensis]
MALDLQRTARRRMRIVLMVAAGLVVLTGGVVVGVIAGSSSGDSDSGKAGAEASSHDEGGQETGSDDQPEPGPTRTVEPSEDYTAPDEWVRLPAASGETDGLPTGWPQTPEGAVALVAASSRNSWTWDEEQIARGIRAYTSDHEQDALLSMVDGSAAGIRELVGLPPSGRPPEDASLSATVIGVQWEEMSEDEVRVSALVRIVFTPGGGVDVRTQVHSTVNDAVWENDDWKVRTVSPEVVQGAPEAAELGSQEFIDAGWIALQEGDVR